MPTLEEMRAWLAGDDETSYGESLEVRKCGGTGNAAPSTHEGGVDLERMAAASGKKYTVSTDGRDAVLRFGKFKGDSVSDLAKSISGKGYLGWVLEKDFPDELHDIIKLYGIHPKRGEK